MIVIITHANCNDGFTAAWIACNYYRTQGNDDIKFIELNYQQAKNDSLDELIRDNTVKVFDFSFPRATMERYARIARSFRVADHHESAEKDCAGLDYCIFDMKKSGAVLAWEHFYGPKPVPKLVQYVQDRDLWLFNLPDSRKVNAYLGSWQRQFTTWDSLNYMVNDRLNEVVEAGSTILRIQEAAIGKAYGFASTIVLGNYRVPFLNLTSLISETLEVMAKDKPFASSFFLSKEGGFVFSLRSAPDGLNVSDIAKQYGGGGHAHAAGFTVDLAGFEKLLETRQ